MPPIYCPPTFRLLEAVKTLAAILSSLYNSVQVPIQNEKFLFFDLQLIGLHVFVGLWAN